MSKKTVGKLSALLAMVVAVVTLSGCELPIGNFSKGESQKDLFPDLYDSDTGLKKTSNESFKFEVDDCGEMTVYLDTTKGYSYDVDDEEGFEILDKDDDVVLTATKVELDEYKSLTADVEKTKKFNNRKFLYRKDDDTKVAYSYMADVGLDCGLVLEAEDKDCFSLIAFRGEALDDSSSDPEDYKGDESDIIVEDEEVEEVEAVEAVEEEEVVADAVDASGNVPLPEKLKKRLNSLNTDYVQVAWEQQYSIEGEDPNVVISTTSYESYGYTEIVVAVTNMTKKDIEFFAEMTVFNQNGDEVGYNTIYEIALGVENTNVYVVGCNDEVSDYTINWKSVDIRDANYDRYIPWQADYSATAGEYDSVDVSYDFYSANGEDMNNGTITILLLDSKGKVLARGFDYFDESLPAGDSYHGEVNVIGDSKNMKRTANIAMFSNPIVPR